MTAPPDRAQRPVAGLRGPARPPFPTFTQRSLP